MDINIDLVMTHCDFVEPGEFLPVNQQRSGYVADNAVISLHQIDQPEVLQTSAFFKNSGNWVFLALATHTLVIIRDGH